MLEKKRQIFIFQLLNFILGAVVSAIILSCFSGTGAYNFWIEFLPYTFIIYLVLAIVMTILFRCKDILTETKRAAYFSGFGLLFFIIYFAIYLSSQHPTIKQKFTEAESKSCKITKAESALTNFEETYSAYRIQFKDEDGQIQYGYGCSSSTHDNGDYRHGNYIKRNSDIEISCTYSDDELPEPYFVFDDLHPTAQPGSNVRMLYQNYDVQQYENQGYNYLDYLDGDIDYDGEEFNSFGSDTEELSSISEDDDDSLRILKSSSSSGTSSKSKKKKTKAKSVSSLCYESYEFSEVKITPYLCVQLSKSKQRSPSKVKQEFNVIDNCYYNIYGNKSKAEINSVKNLEPREVKDFYQVILDKPTTLLKEIKVYAILANFFLFGPSMHFLFYLPVFYLVEKCFGSCVESSYSSGNYKSSSNNREKDYEMEKKSEKSDLDSIKNDKNAEQTDFEKVKRDQPQNFDQPYGMQQPQNPPPYGMNYQQQQQQQQQYQPQQPQYGQTQQGGQQPVNPMM